MTKKELESEIRVVMKSKGDLKEFLTNKFNCVFGEMPEAEKTKKAMGLIMICENYEKGIFNMEFLLEMVDKIFNE